MTDALMLSLLEDKTARSDMQFTCTESGVVKVVVCGPLKCAFPENLVTIRIRTNLTCKLLS